MSFSTADEQYNSSDVELEPVTSKRNAYQVGQTSIDKIIEDAQADRLKSKKTVKQLEFGHGTAGWRYLQDLWIRRFETFREYSLQQDVNRTFTGDDMIRFFDSIIGKLRSSIGDKSAPGREYVISGLRILLSYGTFRFADFKLTPHEGARLKTFFSDAVQNGRLTEGIWQKRVWLSFMMLARIASEWLDHHHRNGTLLWDCTIARLMSVVLIASLGCRSGEVTRTIKWKNAEYMKWSDINLTVNGEPLWQNIKGHIVIRYEKGNKTLTNENRDVHMQPLDDPKYNMVCPIALLVTHALRHGLVEGSTVTDILTRACARSDRRIVWKFPLRPVCPAFCGRGSARCLLDKAAITAQALETLKQMGLISNILTRVHVHALREGHARDVAHLEDKSGQGMVTNAVRQSLGHTERSYRNGTTQKYIGDHTALLYNDRVQNQWVDPLAPLFGSTSAHALVKGPVSATEIEAWHARHEGLTSTNPNRYARDAIRRERLQNYLTTAEPESPTKGKAKAKPLRQKSTNEINAMPEAEETPIDFHIDPRLLSEGLLEDNVDQGELDNLENMLFLPNSSSQTAQLEDFATQGHLNDMHNTLSATDFIGLYSAINVSTNFNFAKTWNKLNEQNKVYNDSVEPVMPLGNSRDLPTPFVHHCKAVEGCTFETIMHGALTTHETTCTKERVEKLKAMASLDTKYECNHCHQRFKTQPQRRYHVDETHLWVPKRCDEEGCDSTEVFETSNKLNRHKIKQHSARYPTRCTFPECTSSSIYNSQSTLAAHLARNHGLRTRAERKPYFPAPKENMVKVWLPCQCHLAGCRSKTTFIESSHYRLHLMDAHKYSGDEATELRDSLFQTMTTSERNAVKKERDEMKAEKRSKKRSLTDATKASSPKKSRL